MADDPKPIPQPVTEVGLGDTVHIVFWRAEPWPDNPHRGTWQTMPVRVICSGRGRVVVEVAATTPSEWLRQRNEVGFHNSTLRFVPMSALYATADEADTVARKSPDLPPPS